MPIVSRPYAPSRSMCCEKCTFGSGEHAKWCEHYGEVRIPFAMQKGGDFASLEFQKDMAEIEEQIWRHALWKTPIDASKLILTDEERERWINGSWEEKAKL